MSNGESTPKPTPNMQNLLRMFRDAKIEGGIPACKNIVNEAEVIFAALTAITIASHDLDNEAHAASENTPSEAIEARLELTETLAKEVESARIVKVRTNHLLDMVTSEHDSPDK